MTEWISVSEKLPPENHSVLVWTESNDTYMAFLMDRDFHRSGDCSMLDNVLFWQPLPPPPKKKRWMPKEGERFFHITSYGTEYSYWRLDIKEKRERIRECFGVYKTEQEAQEMLDKIKAFVTEQIGEV